KQTYTAQQHAQADQALLSHRDAVLALGQDLPRLWNAPTTSAKDRKRMLRLLLKDITITKAAKTALLQIRWHGGATEELRVPLRPNAADQWRHDPALVERVRELAQQANDEQIVAHLNQAGVTTRKGNRVTVSAIRWIRFKHAIPVPTLKRPEERTVS